MHDRNFVNNITLATTHFLESLWQDCLFAARMLWKQPAVTLMALIVLALGIGATTTIFSALNTVVLAPLPYKDADRLVRLWESNLSQGRPENPVSVPNFRDWQRQQSDFEQLAASELTTFNLTDFGEPQRIPALRVTSNLTPTLGVLPFIGRSFLPEEETSGRNRVALLSYGLWQRLFGGDPSILNQNIQLDGENYLVVGIMPQGFQFLDRELWVPLVLDAAKEPWRADRANRNLSVIGRLKSNVQIDKAISDMNVIASRLADAHPQENTGWGLHLRSFYDWIVPQEVRWSMIALFIFANLLLLVVCASVANLLLVRSTTRQEEMAIRAALGARPMRLVRQLLAESFWLAGLAGVFGLVLAYWGTKLLASSNLPNIARLSDTHIEPKVIAFTLGITLVTVFVFGLTPAWLMANVNLTDRLKASHRIEGRITHRFRRSLIVCEVTLAVALIVAAGLLVRTVRRFQTAPLGFNSEHLMTMQISLPASKYGQRDQRVDFFNRLLEQLRTVPGVIDAAASESAPASAADWTAEITVEDDATGINEARTSGTAHVATTRYFRTLGIPLIRGREFNEEYHADRPLEVVVSESFARRYWPNGDALDKRFRAGKNNPFATVVGIAGDLRSINPQQEAPPAFYFPYGYVGMPGLVILIRTIGQPQTIAATLRAQVQQVDRDQPVYNVRTMKDILAAATSQQRLLATLLNLFGLLALLIVAGGIYAVVSQVVSQRAREIAVRIALGADTREILTMVIAQAMSLVMVGLILGLVGSFALTVWLGSLVSGLRPNDPVTFVFTTLLLTTVGFTASYIPARRATKLNPSTVLRN